MSIRWWVGAVSESIRETPTASSLIIDVPDWPGHLPGQHVDVRLTAEDGYQAVRSYSIASAPERGRLALTVERLEDGEVSPYLVDDVHPGDPLEFFGPIGGFFIWTDAMGGPLLLIAGGSGIAPLMSMIRARAANSSSIPARLLYSARSAEDLIYQEEINRLAGSDDLFQTNYTLTRQQPVSWDGYRRRIDLEMLRDIAWGPEDRPLVYICGPTPFVEVASTLLVEMGHDPERIRTERFGPTGG